MKNIIDLLKQILKSIEDFNKPIKCQLFSVKTNNKGHIVGYLRPEYGAIYCSMSISNFKLLLKNNEIPKKKISEKISLVRISDIDDYIEKKSKENN